MVKVFYKIESLAIFLFAVFAYSTIEINFWTFLLFLFIPDISMAGYFYNKKIGAIIYNIGHSYALGLLLTFIGMMADGGPLGFIPDGSYLAIAGVIIIAHTSFDRLLGFGLKYPTNFKDTHIQKL